MHHCLGLAKTKARLETRCAALSLLEVIPIQWLLEQRELQLNSVQPTKIGWRATWCSDVSLAVLQTVQDSRAETRLRLAALRCLVQTSTCDYESFAVVGVASSDLGGLSYCMETNGFVLTLCAELDAIRSGSNVYFYAYGLRGLPLSLF